MKYIVTPHSGDPYEVDADMVEVNETNPNQVVLKKGSKVVAVENSAASVRPKNA